MNGAKYLLMTKFCENSEFSSAVNDLIVEILAHIDIDFVTVKDGMIHFEVTFPNHPATDIYVKVDKKDDTHTQN